MARSEKVSANTPWTDDELRQSVDVYVLLLRLQLRGSEERSEPVAQALLLDPLVLRNDAAIRYRMRNISAVVKDLGGPVLTDFSPAESVGKLVRPRIRAMLLDDPDFSRLLGPTPGVGGDDLGNAKKALSILRRQIEDLEAELAWRGRNGPPEANEVRTFKATLHEARDDIRQVEAELEKTQPDKLIVEAGSSRLLAFAQKLMRWIGDRATKFIDAALVAGAPIVVAKATGLLPSIVNAMEAVGRVGG